MGFNQNQARQHLNNFARLVRETECEGVDYVLLLLKIMHLGVSDEFLNSMIVNGKKNILFFIVLVGTEHEETIFNSYPDLRVEYQNFLTNYRSVLERGTFLSGEEYEEYKLDRLDPKWFTIEFYVVFLNSDYLLIDFDLDNIYTHQYRDIIYMMAAYFLPDDRDGDVSGDVWDVIKDRELPEFLYDFMKNLDPYCENDEVMQD